MHQSAASIGPYGQELTNKKTGRPVRFATEYYSTLLPLQVLKYLYDITGDKRCIEVAARQAALHNWVVFGNPSNCLKRRREVKVK